jgi:hypothetical protein
LKTLKQKRFGKKHFPESFLSLIDSGTVMEYNHFQTSTSTTYNDQQCKIFPSNQDINDAELLCYFSNGKVEKSEEWDEEELKKPPKKRAKFLMQTH